MGEQDAEVLPDSPFLILLVHSFDSLLLSEVIPPISADDSERAREQRNINRRIAPKHSGLPNQLKEGSNTVKVLNHIGIETDHPTIGSELQLVPEQESILPLGLLGTGPKGFFDSYTPTMVAMCKCTNNHQ